MENSDALVKVFTTPTCGFCQVVKGYLHSQAVEFEEIDLSQDQTAAQWLVETTGQLGVPVTLFGDKNFVIGWQKNEIEACLRELKLIK